MTTFSLPIKCHALSDLPLNSVHKGKQDLLVLEYMAQRLALTVQTLDAEEQSSPPYLYLLTERGNRTHRIVLYQPQQLLQEANLSFVGFVSARQIGQDATIDQGLSNADQNMLAELVHVPGLMGYSSLEIRQGCWHNLVFFAHTDTVRHLKQTESHQHAAYQLAPRAYTWIRIHVGLMTGGLAGGQMQLLRSKHYATDLTVPQFRMYEVFYV
ncbi:MAG TPA: hypothetical protein VL461_10135 [Dictyobacter sp.]|jgi:hypothetical protein|nr:hypothetical protein [Dictyobacter sp.]